jgi:hypothetical protein
VAVGPHAAVVIASFVVVRGLLGQPPHCVYVDGFVVRCGTGAGDGVASTAAAADRARAEAETVL